MQEPLLILFLLLCGILLGFVVGWIISKAKYSGNAVSNSILEEKYVDKSLFQVVEKQLDESKILEEKKRIESLELEKRLSEKDRDIQYLEEKLFTWKSDFDKLQNKAHHEFENLANRIFEEKTAKFTKHNEVKLNDLLQPLRENIKDFSKDIERRFTEEAKDKVSLKKEIEQLRDLNTQLSSDAKLLASALKGDSKIQGDWGEVQLQMILEKAGLLKDTHFIVQPSFKDENGKDKRPDFIINLPEKKHIVIDSKVSLKAYEKYFNADNEDKQKRFLKSHIDSIRTHIKDLGSKNYQNLYQINSPDYLLLFVPIEPAFAVALQHDSKLFLDALDKNIVLVTSSTLLATMRTVSFIWRQEQQKKNVLEIARQSGLLYDKFVGFVDDLNDVGSKLNSAQSAWGSAMNKLSDSKKYGDTLIGRAEKIKKLGAKASKELPKELLEN